MKTIENVHIIPLGFERSVAVNPVRTLGGVRAHIITIGSEFAKKYDPKMAEKQKYFEKVVVDDLRKMDIDVKVHYADLFDFKMAIGVISRIILQEKSREKEGRKVEIYVNISSHGRLVSVASALASWYHGVKAYYGFPDRYAKDESEEKEFGRSICGKHPRILEVPPIWMLKLSDEERHALKFIYEEKCKGKEFVMLDEIIEEFKREFHKTYRSISKDRNESDERRERQEIINKINRRVLNKLESREYIERIKIGRRTAIKITELGEFMTMLEIGI